MKKMIFPALFVLFFVAFTLIMASVLYTDGTAQPSPNAQVAIVAHGNESGDRWKALEAGVRQACRELDIESAVMNIAATRDSGMQFRLIEREIDSGISGLLIAPDNSAEMAVELERLYFLVPTVYVLNGIPDFDYVAADDAGMAELLAEKLASLDGGIALLTENSGRESVSRRLEAFLASMQAAGREVTIIQSAQEIKPAGAGAQAPVLVAALDTETLESAIDTLSDSDDTIRLYGIGSTDKIVHAMTQGVVEGVVFQNEYAAGYIAMMQLAMRMGLIVPAMPSDIQYMYVDRLSLYEPDIERLLFPIVQ